MSIVIMSIVIKSIAKGSNNNLGLYGFALGFHFPSGNENT